MTNPKIVNNYYGPWGGAKLPRTIHVSRHRGKDGCQGGLMDPGVEPFKGAAAAEPFDLALLASAACLVQQSRMKCPLHLQ